MPSKQGSELSQWLFSSEALVVAALPIVGALLAFSFEAGFLWHYGVPLGLMRIDVVRIAVASVVMVPLMAIFVLYVSAWRRVITGGGPLREYFLTLVAAVCLVAAAFSLLDLPRKWWVLASAVVVAILSDLLLPLWSRSEGSSYFQAFKAYHSHPKPESFDDRRVFHLKGVAYLVVVACLFVAYIGKWYAQEKEDYYMVPGHRFKAVVEVYDGLAVMVAFDPETKEILPELTLFPLAGGTVVLRREPIGELQRGWSSQKE